MNVNKHIKNCQQSTNFSNAFVITDYKKRDVVFLLDSSDGSLQGFTDIKDFVQSIVVDLNIDPHIDRVAVVQYSNRAETDFNLGRYSTVGDVLNAVRGLKHKGGYPPNTGAALQYVKDHVFTTGSGSRILEGVPQILILLSGGRGGDDLRTPARVLRETGVISIAIGTSDADTLELQTISHMPSYALSITDFKELPTAKSGVFSLIREASKSVEQTTPTKVYGKMLCYYPLPHCHRTGCSLRLEYPQFLHLISMLQILTNRMWFSLLMDQLT